LAMNIEWREWGAATGLTRLRGVRMNREVHHVA
jgi:hypothetical protein